MKNKKWIKHLNCKDCGWSKPTTFPDASIADIMFIEDIGVLFLDLFNAYFL